MPYRNPEDVLRYMDYGLRLEELGDTRERDELARMGIRVLNPFWRNLPHCNIFTAIAPDILHQLHKGAFKDHAVEWAIRSFNDGFSEAEMDQRFRAMPDHPEIRHFSKGITTVTQWTGNEHKHMEKIFLGVLAGTVSEDVLRPIRAIIDFIYYAHFATHTDTSLDMLDAAWKEFHESKNVFIENEVRKDFNIPKIHSMAHYPESIRNLGAADGTNSENTEYLHIDLAKDGYNASNKRQYTTQMTKYLSRREAIRRQNIYLRWSEPEAYADEALPNSLLDGILEDQDDESNEPIESQSYQIAQRPEILRLTALEERIGPGADQFRQALNDYLVHAARQQVETPHDNLQDLISDELRLGVFKRVYLHQQPMGQVGKQVMRETIRAVPNHLPEKAVHADTVLAREYAPQHSHRGQRLAEHDG